MKYDIYIYEQNKTMAFYQKAIAEYEKRLSRYCKITCQWIKKEKEWKKVMENNSEGYVVVPGKHSCTSEELSRQIGKWEISGKGKIIFLIPGIESQDAENIFYKNTINLSDFTMNTAMTAMILYEQIYRGYRIMNHHPYHK